MESHRLRGFLQGRGFEFTTPETGCAPCAQCRAHASVASGGTVTCTATITNEGTASAAVSWVPTSSDSAFVPSTDCPASLAGGATCTVTVVGKPVTQGTTSVSIAWPLTVLKTNSQTISVTVTPPAETVFVYDDFTGPATYLTSHVGQVGAAWSAYPGNASNYSVAYPLDGLGNLFGPGFTRAGVVVSSGKPGPTDEYYIEMTLKGDPPYDAWNYFGYLTVGVWSPNITVDEGYIINLYNSSQGHQQIFMTGATTRAGSTKWGTAWYNMGWTPEFSAIEFGVPHVLRFEFYHAKKRILLDGQLLSEFADREAGPAGPLYLQYTRGVVVSKVKMAKL